MLKCPCLNVSIRSDDTLNCNWSKKTDKLDDLLSHMVADSIISSDDVKQDEDLVKVLNEKFINSDVIIETVKTVNSVKTNQDIFNLVTTQDTNSLNFEWIDSHVLIVSLLKYFQNTFKPSNFYS